MKLAVLTGGGDCPGLNAAIRGVVYRAARTGHSVVGAIDGWKGLRDGNFRPLAASELSDAIVRGGTLLGTSRTNPFKSDSDANRLLESVKAAGLDALVAIGGDDTLSAAREFARRGGRVVGVPKTMDNDVGGTDWTFGFDSASSVAVDAVERLRDTARSHHRAIVLEVMGRDAGWVALATGLASGADYTIVPEEPYREEELFAHVRSAMKARGCALVVASEGADLGAAHGTAGGGDQFGHELLKERGVGALLAQRIEGALKIETRSAQIGHIQRGGPPTLFDRILATRLGVKAVDLVNAGQFGTVAVLRGEQVTGISLDEALARPKRVSADWLDLLHTFDA
ncbi:MAG TPA: ATP-dependent 6-phosphofructokinase [Thermoplasmata archaeon]|nr:ATP-dependent 6-phosphofructokinase [Thermoplasmata archaeon]